VSLQIEQGTTVGIAGPSGSGKTTLVDVLVGLLQPGAGAISIDGIDVQSIRPEWQYQIGYVPQRTYVGDRSVRENVALGMPRDVVSDDAVWEALRIACMDRVVADWPDGLDTLIGEDGVKLSAGERQRIGIARALFRNAPVLVFDEATSALDYETESRVMASLGSLSGSRTLVFVAHRLSTLRYVDQIILMEAGRVNATGTYHELLDRNERFRGMVAAGVGTTVSAEPAPSETAPHPSYSAP